MHENKWREMAEVTAAVLKLNARDFPAAYAYDAMAHLKLDEFEMAEKSAREGLRIDTALTMPKLDHLLGVVLMRKRDFPAAIDHLKRYLQAAPNAPEADFVRDQISLCEMHRRNQN
jgi:tetratricopeptide (TPR) repeat protein